MKESLVSQVDSTETLAPEAAGGERLRMAYRPGNGGFVAILSACRTFGRQVGWHIGCHGGAVAMPPSLQPASRGRAIQAVFASDDFGG